MLGCVSSGSKPEFQQLQKLPSNICTVAVLPIVNDTDYSQGSTIFYRIFSAELVNNTNLNIVQEGDVRKVLRQLKIPPTRTSSLEETLIVADRLNIDAIIIGNLIIMEEKRGGKRTEPQLAVDLKILDGTTGKTILTSYLNKSGEGYRKVMHFGLVNNITELTKLVSKEIIMKWKKEGVRGCIEK